MNPAPVMNPAPAARRRRQGGFTLVELMVVVAVMAVLAMVGLPSASMSNDRKLDMLQLQIQDAITHAQTLSYHSGERYAVKFDVQGQWFAVLNEVGVPVDDPLTKRMYVVFLDRPDQPSGIRMDSVVFGLRPLAAFNDKGILTKEGTVLISADGQTRQLSMNTSTARFTELPISE